eukprot:CAMPEP_0114600824 /NCGR_PEP_ID=MMETSP0125-20121206/23453_1 /TAXON_ID=485358 ORGANISM="Aristerostoma sp., Strain ATCC 50986" /NCGR_SAMPLE_ID=MMETSP0125 /ASSEMBLY_ACC=CAM_ASM_000245 /LENGTH=71 /DNA_ID=CAMNT_0001809459 /DNA_START=1 /DNA_END=213 /DNA_ORIENTATION=-
MDFNPSDQVKAAEDMKAILDDLTTGIFAAAGPFVMFALSPALLWAIINLLQVFYYFLYVNVDYPYNAKIFF